MLNFLTRGGSQVDSIQLPALLEYELESYIENIGEEVDFDYNTALESLTNYRHRPLNLNKATASALEDLGLLSVAQINSLLKYRAEVGPLIVIYELQAVPLFDLNTIQRILPYVTVNKTLDQLQETLSAILKKSQKQLFLRWGRNIELPKGFLADDNETPAFLGDPNRLYARYIQSYGHRLSFGLTVEKDAGEEFFKGSNRGRGFDFISAHFFYKNINPRIKRLVLGDFRVKFGQGLIINTGFTPGKSAFVTNIKQSGPALNRFTSVNEQNYLRGFGLTTNLSDEVELTSFASLRKRDGTSIQVDTSELDFEIQNFTSLQLSGLHRTQREIDARNTLQQFTAGLSLKYSKNRESIAFNILINQLDRPVGRTPQPYNQFFFNSQGLINVSIDYNYPFKNFIFFGEAAWSDNNSLATVNGLIAHLHPKVTFALHSRLLPRNFHSLFGQSFTETAGVNNENGIYAGLEIRPTRNWQLAAYIDNWQHPWLRFRADAPSRGQEYFARLSYTRRRKLEAYIHWKYERKQQSYRLDYTKLDELLFNTRTNLRVHIDNKINSRLTLRSRLEWSFFSIEESFNPFGQIWYESRFQDQEDTDSRGFLIYQDILYKPVNLPLSITTRFAVFDVERFDARIYAFENDVTYQFSIPAYFNKGTRFYVNLKYRAPKHLILEARFAQTFWANQDGFSSGNNRVEGQMRSDVKVQLRWRF